MDEIKARRGPFLQYARLHKQLKTYMEELGWPVTNDGQLFAFACLVDNSWGKPGPKPKKGPEAKKTGPKLKKKTGPKPGKLKNNVMKGRREVIRGDRPPIKDAIAKVIGSATRGSADIVAGLKKRGWLPNAANPQQYVSYVLSSNPDVFERPSRGQYRVRAAEAEKKAPEKKAEKAPSKSDKLFGHLASNRYITTQALAKRLNWKATDVTDILKDEARVVSRLRNRNKEWKLAPVAATVAQA